MSIVKKVVGKLYSIVARCWVRFYMSKPMERFRFHHNNFRNFGFTFAESYFKNGKNKTVKLFNTEFSYSNEFWFFHSLQEIFIDKTYWFKSDTQEPYIIDCGSNIGLSVIYFKRLYPEAKVIAFEPDSYNFKLLEKNVKSFGLNNVQCNQKAIWTTNETLQFTSSENSVGSKLSTSNSVSTSTPIEAVALSVYLEGRIVDFLKIDIEGAEFEVIRSCRDHLKNVRNLFIEYHSLPDQPQQLHHLLETVHEAGFRYYMKEAWENLKYPYVHRNPPMFDLQLNIFAYRPT